MKLSHFLKHKYFKRVPEWHYCLERLLSKKCQVPTLHNPTPVASSLPASSDDWVSLHEMLVEMCPHMSPTERADCLRYLALKSEKDHRAVIESKKKESHVAKQQALANRFTNLKSIFTFFDRGNLGVVNKDDIMLVLKKTVQNKQQEKLTATHGESVSYHEVHHQQIYEANDPLVPLIEELDNGKPTNLNFTEFVKLFENVFGY